MLPPDLATDLASEIRADIDRAKAAILDSLLARLDRLAAVVPLDLPEPDADENEAQGSATDDGVMIFDLERLAEVWPDAAPDAAPDVDEDKAPAPEPVDADEYRAMVRPAAPEPEPEPDEFAVIRAAPAAAPEVTPEPPKRPRRRTPPPAPAPLPGPVDEAVDGDEGDGFAPF